MLEGINPGSCRIPPANCRSAAKRPAHLRDLQLPLPTPLPPMSLKIAGMAFSLSLMYDSHFLQWLALLGVLYCPRFQLLVSQVRVA
jgi:hypothetical protein